MSKLLTTSPDAYNQRHADPVSASVALRERRSHAARNVWAGPWTLKHVQGDGNMNVTAVLGAVDIVFGAWDR